MDVTVGRRQSQGMAVRIPASKSLSHRALIAAALAPGESLIQGLADNQDTQATIRALTLLSAQFASGAEGLRIQGIRDWHSYAGQPIDCGESGSTLRFLIPLFSLTGKRAVFTGSGRLLQRPQTVYEDLYRQFGLVFEHHSDCLVTQGTLPFGRYQVRGDISSQFISGLLFVLPLLAGDSDLKLTGQIESASYIGLTCQTLAHSGIRLQTLPQEFQIPGRQIYQPLHRQIPGDDSQGAFFACLAMLSHQPMTVLGMDHDSPQGDHAIVRIIEQMGGQAEPVEGGYRFVPGELHGTAIDLADCPDLGPVLFALATQAAGTTVFTHAGRLRLKESDRIACMQEELTKLGMTMVSDDDTVQITGRQAPVGNVSVSGHNDHRIVMALAVLSAAAAQPVQITGAQAVNKSYPDFFSDLQKAGVEVKL